MLEKSKGRIEKLKGWEKDKIKNYVLIPHYGQPVYSFNRFHRHYFADYESFKDIAMFSEEKCHQDKFMNLARKAQRDQAICCKKYHEFIEKYEKHDCKLHTLNLGHRCRFSTPILLPGFICFHFRSTYFLQIRQLYR